ncbi:MAG: NADP-dependent phosphogluconate dehydrogenase [Thermomicrobiales bacterium]|nr:NADP-dependent phosphogluconate dehydrogenase [Thermomicrobiales bacterium]
MTTTAARHVGVIGLAVMGENLALNIERNGFPIAVYNRTWERTEEFINGRASGLNVAAGKTLPEFVALLERPRRIIIMVKAGAPVDAVIAELIPLLQEGDMIIDGGNSLFIDSERRSKEVEAANLHFVGMGISGGEEGALWGPSLMPGGPKQAYILLEPMLQAIAAKAEDGEPCVTHIGPGGSGHYVKMIHNGIEYGDMQLIAESYDVMRHALGMTAPQIAAVFAEWNKGPLASYLIEITAEVLAYTDPETGAPLVDLILDTAEQKGTGRWTSQNALELGSPIPTIDAAVFARTMSSMKERRVAASQALKGPNPEDIAAMTSRIDPPRLLGYLERGLLFAKISSYAQGMALLRAASDSYNWGLDLAEIARIWRAGCIIRAELLEPIRAAFGAQPDLENLLLSIGFLDIVNEGAGACRSVVTLARSIGVPVPAHSASLDYFDSYRTAALPANLTQGQRDYFGAHTYRRIDKPGIFHTEWNAEPAS